VESVQSVWTQAKTFRLLANFESFAVAAQKEEVAMQKEEVPVRKEAMAGEVLRF
jgi:hypothetical protein